MSSSNFNRRFAVSPTNPNGFGKARTVATATISVSIPGYKTGSDSWKYIPVAHTAKGTVKAKTIGRY